MQSALFVGRFQPFHNGHLDVVKKILKKNERVIIVIGSAEKNFLLSNPFTAGERFEMIDQSLREAKIPCEKYAIIPVRNVNNYALWVNHINIHVPNYTRLYTGSEIVRACYEGKYHRKDGTSKVGPEIVQLKRELEISASAVRELILEDNPEWKKLVPKAVVKLMTKWHSAKRLHAIKDTIDVTKYNNEY